MRFILFMVLKPQGHDTGESPFGYMELWWRHGRNACEEERSYCKSRSQEDTGSHKGTPNSFEGHYSQPSCMRHCFLTIPLHLNAALLGTDLLTHQPLETRQSQTTVGECRLSQVGCASGFRTAGVCPCLRTMMYWWEKSLVERGPTLS